MQLRSAGAAALFLVAGLAAASARASGGGFGPEFGNNTLNGEIQNLVPASPDVDDFVAVVLPGEVIQAKIGAARKSSVRLVITVLDPDGDDRTDDVQVASRKGGKSVQIKPFTVDEAGAWTIRVEGIGGTEGAYVCKFKIKGPPKIKLKKQQLGGATTERTHTFAAHDRTRVDITVKWGKKDTSVELRDLSGPVGVVSGIFGEDDTALFLKQTTLKLSDHLLDAGSGDYDLLVGIPEGNARYKLQIVQRPPARASGSQNITSVNDPHLDPRETPIRSAAGQPVRITGRNFAINPVPDVYFGPYKALVVAVAGARDWIDAIVPPGEDGATQGVTVVNTDGQSASQPDYILYVAEAVIDEVVIVSGPVLGTDGVLRAGGNVLEVRGRNFLPVDTATVGGVGVARTSPTSTSYRVTVPPHAAGTVDLLHTDEFGRVQTVTEVVHHVGFDDVTGSVTPSGGAVDDLSAWDGLIGDLDNDGRRDDVVLLTYDAATRPYPGYFQDPERYYNWYDVFDNPVGTRTSYTRLFFANAGGVLEDRTTARMPATTPENDWSARGAAIGDLDGDVDQDLLLAGSTYVDDVLGNVPALRALSNNGSGTFTFEAAWDSGIFSRPVLTVVNELYPPNENTQGESSYEFASARTAPASYSTIAVGDLDGDDDPDVVAGFAGFGRRAWYFDPTPVDYSGVLPYIHSSQVVPMAEVRYYPGTRVFENDIAGGTPFTDVTATRMPTAGRDLDAPLPAFQARHLTLGDVDGDDDLDLVVTWNNPASVLPASALTSFGYYKPFSHGKYYYRFAAATAQPRVATRVLTNDGTGKFTDATSTWMPPGSGNEFWQGHRVVLHDLDGDGDLDMVLGHRRALFEWRNATPTFARPSLRVLRNDGTSFTDVTATAVPTPAGTPGPGNVFRGRAIAVGDIDQDGYPEILVGTNESLTVGGAPAASTRVLWGGPGLVFTLHDEFVPGTDVDTGEVHAILIGDLDRDMDPAVILVGEDAPATSTGAEHLRAFDWAR